MCFSIAVCCESIVNDAAERFGAPPVAGAVGWVVVDERDQLNVGAIVEED